MSSYLSFYLVPKKEVTKYPEGREKIVKLSEGVPLKFTSYSRNNEIYQAFNDAIHPAYCGMEDKYTELTTEKMNSVINHYRYKLEEEKKAYTNRCEVLKAVGSKEWDNIQDLLLLKEDISLKEQTLEELVMLKDLFEEIKYGDFEKVLCNVD